MCQVLFTIPIINWPVPGYGVMLLCAFVACLWLAKRLGRKAGIEPVIFSDLGYWLFITGILGARILYVVVSWQDQFQRWSGLNLLYHIVAVWDGGLVFYGSAFGGLLGYYLVDRHYQKIYPFDRWKMIDVMAPCIALGLCLGRIGCLLNGCCYGNLACPNCPAIAFPLSAAARAPMVDRGVQTTAGFTLERDHQRIVDWVEPGSGADVAGLKKGDEIVGVNDVDLRLEDLLQEGLREGSPGDKEDKKTMSLTVLRADRTIEIRPFAIADLGPRTTTGFTIDPDHARIVASVGADSEAAKAGLQPGDKIVGVNGRSVHMWDGSAFPFHEAFRNNWPRGKNDLSLIVLRDGHEIDIGPFTHWTVRLHPTQLYESTSMILLVFFLLSIYPYNRVDGLIMVIFMVGYAVHRFLNESLRNDTDPVAFGMTLSQNVSIILLIGAAILGFFVWRHNISKRPASAEPIAPPPSTAIAADTHA